MKKNKNELYMQKMRSYITFFAKWIFIRYLYRNIYMVKYHISLHNIYSLLIVNYVNHVYILEAWASL